MAGTQPLTDHAVRAARAGDDRALSASLLLIDPDNGGTTPIPGDPKTFPWEAVLF